ncbi:MAG: hypothetical protein V4475_08340 [Pseudomonadota bacterium]
MTKHSLYYAVATFALAMAIAPPATAQRASTAPRATPAPAPTPAPARSERGEGDPNRYNEQYYLNNGDYAGAAAARRAAAIATGGYTNFENSVNNDIFPNGARDPSQQVYGGFNRDRPNYFSDEDFNLLTARHTPSGDPPGPPGSRTVSNYEQAETALLQARRAELSANLEIAQSLVTHSIYASPAAQQEAAAQLRRIQENYDNLSTTLALTERYAGRSFPDEATAEQYVRYRTDDIAIMQQSSITAQQQALLNSMSPYTANGRVDVRGDEENAYGSDHVNTQRNEMEAIQRRIDVVDAAGVRNRRTAETSFPIETYQGGNPAGAAAIAAQRFGDTSVLPGSPGARAVQAAVARTAGGNVGAGAAAAAGIRPPTPPTPPGTAGRDTGRAIANAGGNLADDALAASAAAAARAAAATSGRPTAPSPVAEVEDNTPPRPVPTAPDYPVHVRTQAERDAYDRQRAAVAAQAAAARQAALQREYEAESARQADIARREAARLANERARIAAAAQALAASNTRWNAMVRDRFNSAVWDAFAANGGTLTTLQLEAIYADYDPRNTIPPAQSLSSAPNSLSAAGNSLSAAGTAVVSGTDDYNDPAVQSLYEVLYGLTQHRGPFDRGGTDQAGLADAVYRAGSFDVQSDPDGRWGRESGGYLAATLLDDGTFLHNTTVNGVGGLDQLLAQPFNVLLTWGAGAYDLDLHMTGPLGAGVSDRFHIYYNAPGDLTAQPFAALIKDCICTSGSEVILTSALNRGGVYRLSVFNYGDQAAGSANLANMSGATIQIVRGGTAVSQGNGTTIVGGHVLLTTNVPNGQTGNTWIAAEINPSNGRITVPRAIVQNGSDADVH